MDISNFIKLVTFLLCFASLTVFGQRTQNHTVYFENVDGFSGYVKFTTKYAGFATRVHAYNEVLVLTKYDASYEDLEVLAKAGYDLRGLTTSHVTPSSYGFDIVGRAYIVTPLEHRACRL